MNFVINFLSIIIIWSVLYYFINNTETFQNNTCPFDPWGPDEMSSNQLQGEWYK